MTTLLDDRAACLACVEQSPAAVAAHDKAAWLAIFANGAVVEDPVGSRPHVHSAALGERSPLARFYETFIAANDIRFHVEADIVCGGCVARDLTIEINMSPRVKVRVPMHLLYELCERDGELKIARLAAHWELAPVLKQQMQYGIASVLAGARAAWRMLRYQGLSGMVGFNEARDSIGAYGRECVQHFVEAFNSGRGARQYFAHGAGVAWPEGTMCDAADWQPPALQLRLDKTLVAGDWVSATVFLCEGDGERKVERRGVALFRLKRESGLIEMLRVLVE